MIVQVLSARGEVAGEAADRLKRVALLFGIEDAVPGVTPLPRPKKTELPKAS